MYVTDLVSSYEISLTQARKILALYFTCSLVWVRHLIFPSKGRTDCSLIMFGSYVLIEVFEFDMQEVVAEWGENVITLRLSYVRFSKYCLGDQLTG